VWSELARGWQALRSAPGAHAVAGANLVASAVYGALTVLLVLIAARHGLGAAGYGYLLAAAGAGAVLATGVANRVADVGRSRRVVGGAVLAVGAPLPVLALGAPLPAVVVLVAVCGAGSLVTEVVGDTYLQRELDPDVFGRAYGLLVPACVAGIVVGALLAPLGVAVFGLGGTLCIVGAGVVVYGARMCYQPRCLSTELSFG
jgi:predicted MFS family arabinose efflux permease